MKNNIRFSLRTKRWFYGIFGVLFSSGVLWLAAHYLFGRYDEFGIRDNSFEPLLMKIHGAAAMVSLMVLGVLIPIHMQRAWGRGRNRRTAVVIVSVCVLLILSGYGLYYLGSEEVRLWISGLHSIIGCLLPMVLLWHVLVGRKTRASSRF